jgi:P4 family phage/plasmid primase-like protien
MTDRMDINKLKKYSDEVTNYINKFRVTEETKDKVTHLSYGSYQGSFSLNKEDRKEFMKKYTKAVIMGVNWFSFLEKQPEFGPIIIDFDFELPTDNHDNKRLYDDKLINKLHEYYVSAISNYLIVEPDNFKMCVFEKDNFQVKDDIIKDGLHFMFPSIVAHFKTRHLIRQFVLNKCINDSIFVKYSNSPDKIIDKSVVSTNAWFLYGSKKPNGMMYKLTKLYDYKGNVINNKDNNIPTEEIIEYVSLQKSCYKKKNRNKFSNNYVESDIEAECESRGINNIIKSGINKYEIPFNKEDDVRKAGIFMNMLSVERANNYKEWIDIGFSLHSIDDSLLPLWIDFSKKSKKYKDGECEKIWRNIKQPNNGNMLTIRSLAYWVKNDDPKGFENFIKEEFKLALNKSLDGSTYPIAKSVYVKYNDRFVCSNIKMNIWYEFKNHRWEKIEGGYTLQGLLSEDFVNLYNKEIIAISNEAIESNGLFKEELQNKRKKLDNIITKLNNIPFKKQIMEECTRLFYDPKFNDKLDSNINLIGCNNGVYDLENSIFRDGKPDDYISLSTGHDYVKWSEKNPYNNVIVKFFEQVLPKDSVRTWFLTVLSSCLSGSVKDEKFYILTGSGSNGKSLTMDLLYSALGEYYISCPISLLTRKRGESSQASPERVRMRGKRCGVYQEADEGEKLNVGLMKEMTGGDKIVCRDLFKGAGEMLEFVPQLKQFLTCNQLPTVPSNDEGTWRRIRVIDFSSKFIDNPTKLGEFKIDNELKNKIKNWSGAFFNYLIHIYNLHYKNCNYLSDPVEVLTSTNQYKAENDYYTEYILESIVVTGKSTDFISCASLLDNFRTWYKVNYPNGKTPKKIEFVKFMNKRFNPPDNDKYRNIIFTSSLANETKVNDLDV